MKRLSGILCWSGAGSRSGQGGEPSEEPHGSLDKGGSSHGRGEGKEVEGRSVPGDLAGLRGVLRCGGREARRDVRPRWGQAEHPADAGPQIPGGPSVH